MIHGAWLVIHEYDYKVSKYLSSLVSAVKYPNNAKAGNLLFIASKNILKRHEKQVLHKHFLFEVI